MTAISLVAFAGGSSQQEQGQRQTLAPGPAQPQQHADSDSQATTQLYQAAESAASLQGPCTSDSDDGSCIGLEAVAEAVMQQGCCGEEGRAVQLMKPFLPAALLVLTKTEGASRFRNSSFNQNIGTSSTHASDDNKCCPALASYKH